MLIRIILSMFALTVLVDTQSSEGKLTNSDDADDRSAKPLFDADSVAIHYYQEYCQGVCRYDEDRMWLRRNGTKRTIWYSKEIKKGGWCLDNGFEIKDLKQYDLNENSAGAFQWLEKRLQPIDSGRVISCWVYMNDSVLTCSAQDYRNFKERLLQSVRR